MNDEIVDPAGAGWRFDKRVPIALIVTLMFQFCGGVWFASSMNTRVEVLERAGLLTASAGDRLVRVETTVQSIDRRLERMEEDGR